MRITFSSSFTTFAEDFEVDFDEDFIFESAPRSKFWNKNNLLSISASFEVKWIVF
jgi:hypothetical protein